MHTYGYRRYMLDPVGGHGGCGYEGVGPKNRGVGKYKQAGLLNKFFCRDFGFKTCKYYTEIVQGRQCKNYIVEVNCVK